MGSEKKWPVWPEYEYRDTSPDGHRVIACRTVCKGLAVAGSVLVEHYPSAEAAKRAARIQMEKLI